MSKISAWNVQTCGTLTSPSAEEKLPESWKQPESMEQCVDRMQPSDGVSWELGRAVEGALQRPAVQHAAESLSWSGGTAALQAVTSCGYRAGKNQWEDVGNLVTNEHCSDLIDEIYTATDNFYISGLVMI